MLHSAIVFLVFLQNSAIPLKHSVYRTQYVAHQSVATLMYFSSDKQYTYTCSVECQLTSCVKRSATIVTLSIPSLRKLAEKKLHDMFIVFSISTKDK